MTGFKAETERGVKSAFAGAAKAGAVALAAFGGFELFKGAVQDAADVQKQIEAVNATFGAGAEMVHKFSDGVATGLGISRQLAESTAARFGIMFQQMGIGGTQAAAMTVNLQKLAGSLGAIRNLDPGEVLSKLPLALAGNTRGLKQLGITIDTTQIKLAALKLGLISNTSQALTPAIRAQAIYALAVGKLPQLYQLAQKHSGDLTNVQRRLSAAWKNAKEDLGTALLPAVTALATSLAHLLTVATKSGGLKTVFSSFGAVATVAFKGIALAVTPLFHLFGDLSKVVGGTKVAVMGLLVAVAVAKLAPIIEAWGTSLVAAIQTARVQFKLAQLEYRGGMSAMKIATISFGATVKAVMGATLIGAIGLAVAYAITHWDKVKTYAVAAAVGIAAAWNDLKFTLLGIGEVIGGGLATYLTAPLRAFLEVANKVTGFLSFLPGLGGAHKKIGQALDALKSVSTGLVGKGIKTISEHAGKIPSDAIDAFSKYLRTHTDKAKNDSKKAIDELHSSIKTSVDAQAPKVKSAADGMALYGKKLADAITSAQQAIAAAVRSAKDNLTTIGNDLADALGKVIDAPLQAQQNQFSLASSKLSLEQLRKSVALPGGKLLSTDPQKALAQLRQIQAQAGNVNRAAIQQFILQYQQAVLQVKTDEATLTKQHATRRIQNLTDALNQGNIGPGKFRAGILAELKRDHVSYKIAGAELGTAFADGFRGSVKGLFDQAKKIAAVPARIRNTPGSVEPKIVDPSVTIQREAVRIATLQHAQAARQIALQERIAKASEKSATTGAQVAALVLGKLPNKPTQKNDGAQAHVTRALHGTTG